jgi:Catalytic LigB subunit of aromatic ring-opening dioxygenase
MAEALAGFATSHATALMEPEEWQGVRTLLRGIYAKHFGAEPPPGPQPYDDEGFDDAARRFAKIEAAQEHISQRLTELAPDLLIIIGNDQDENFGAFGAPQFAIYTGDQALVNDRMSQTSQTYQCDRPFALELLGHLLNSGFDVAQMWEPHGGALSAHAFTQIAHRFLPDAQTAILPVFVNAVTPPFAPPRRYFQFGRALRSALQHIGEGKRVVLCSSGGLSHFTVAQFTLAGYQGPHMMGTICSEFDQGLLAAIRSADFERIAAHSADELVANGDSEFLQGITLLGTLPDGAIPEVLEYEPIYRALTGVWAALWDLT